MLQDCIEMLGPVSRILACLLLLFLFVRREALTKFNANVSDCAFVTAGEAGHGAILLPLPMSRVPFSSLSALCDTRLRSPSLPLADDPQNLFWKPTQEHEKKTH